VRNGRRVLEVTLEPSTGLVGGIDFGNRHVRAAVADFTHTVRGETYLTLPYGHEAASSVAEAARIFTELVSGAGAQVSDVQALAVGLPGPTNRLAGRTLSSAILPGWAGFDVTAEFEAALGVPTTVDNDANLGALAEGLWGVGRGFTDFAYVKVSTGIGAGIVLNGSLYRGITGSAGEIGHTTIEEDGPLCRCGNRGCLETVASTDAVLSLLRPTHGQDLGMRGLAELLDTGDAAAIRVVNDAGREIGRVVAGLCNVLSPAGVIVGGDLGVVAAPLMTGIREALDRYALPAVRAAIELRAGVLGERAEVLGALALVIGDTDRLHSAGLAALHDDIATTVAG
jgi:predicted NBD/HSP70 family sugar kinase